MESNNRSSGYATQEFVQKLMKMNNNDLDKTRSFLHQMNRGTADNSPSDPATFDKSGLDFWGLLESGTIILLDALDELFSDDKNERKKFGFAVIKNADIPNISLERSYNAIEELNLDEIIEGREIKVPEVITCPHCKGTGQTEKGSS
jgi:hypothetical protein